MYMRKKENWSEYSLWDDALFNYVQLLMVLSIQYSVNAEMRVACLLISSLLLSTSLQMYHFGLAKNKF